jgi:hypothetical protein
MKYNPKVNEDVARMPGFAHLHPLQPDATVQGALEVLCEMQHLLAEVTGFKAVTLQPAAGAQGELAGMLMIRAYLRDRGETQRKKVLVPGLRARHQPGHGRHVRLLYSLHSHRRQRQRGRGEAEGGARRHGGGPDAHQPEHAGPL